jgi:hypothetical protein
MRSEQQVTTIVTRAMKNLHLELAQKWGFQAVTIAGATFGLGVTMMIESGYTEEQIVDIVRDLVGGLTGAPPARGAS